MVAKVYRVELRSVFLRLQDQEALGLPGHITQGSVLVVENSIAAAIRTLGSVGYRQSRAHLSPACGNDIEALVGAELLDELGTVLVYTGHGGNDRILRVGATGIRVVGMFYRRNRQRVVRVHTQNQED